MRKKWYLYLTEFFAGVSVMAVELGASRLLAPYFSSSQIVWTIIIGTIMIAMALGNLWGGKTADKNPDPARLYRRILVAALWIAAIPAAGKYLILGISALLVFTVNTNFLIVAAFASCMVIFVFPLFLLGTVTPSLVKYAVGSLSNSGSTVGRMGACNTVGSILGTFLPTFVTIPAVGTAATFLIFSAVLLLIGLAYFISEKKLTWRGILILLLFLLCVAFGRSSSFAFWDENLTYEGESVYNYLQVKEDDRCVILSTNVLFGVQSVMMKDGGLTGMYYDYALAAPVMSGKSAPRVLILGNGTGTFARQCRAYFPGAQVEGVEIDGKITRLASEYFDLPAEVGITEYDGRAYLQAIEGEYDVIMVDAYQDITIPFQMSTVEFFTQVREHLAENGVMVVNMNMHASGENSINVWLNDTICSVFSNVCEVEVPYSTNKEVFASDGDGALTDRLQNGIYGLEDAQLGALLERVSENLKPSAGGSRLLTDDRAPVEMLGMTMIDSLIRDEVRDYKKIYETEGLSGLLKRLR